MEKLAEIAPANRQLELEREPQKKPRFPQQLLEKEESRFIDPKAEAAVMLPELSVSLAPAQLALDTMRVPKRKERNSEGVFASVYDYLLSLFNSIKKSFTKKSRQRARLTMQGERALEQLRYLALLCDATEERSPEEILSAEAAFGAAYYEILNLSANLERMAQPEQEHHTARYSRHMSALLKSTP